MAFKQNGTVFMARRRPVFDLAVSKMARPGRADRHEPRSPATTIIVEDDYGRFSALHDDAGGFPTRGFAEAIAARGARHV
jgi:hypothetical protein